MVLWRNAVRRETMTLRLSQEERMMLQKLADLDGISISDVVRMSLRNQYRLREKEMSDGTARTCPDDESRLPKSGAGESDEMGA
jgi:hypothetical protein